MRKLKHSHVKKIVGFTLIEIMISLTLTLVLITGVLKVFTSMKVTSSKSTLIAELQGNGRFALNVLTNDLRMQNFWGDLAGDLHANKLMAIPIGLSNSCKDKGVAQSSFPSKTHHFNALWGGSADSSTLMNCIFDARVNSSGVAYSEFIQIKRVIADPVQITDPKYYYLTANSRIAEIHSGAVAPSSVKDGRTWQYQNHVYYVREDGQGSHKIPVLMFGRIINNKMHFSPLIDGVESIAFSYGIDATGDSRVNHYIDIERLLTQPNSSVVAVKAFVLVRSALPDSQYKNTKQYQLGSKLFQANDNFHRLLVSSTVRLFNH
ncbi:MAG: PilW family protein [Colwellia sp.]